MNYYIVTKTQVSNYYHSRYLIKGTLLSERGISLMFDRVPECIEWYGAVENPITHGIECYDSHDTMLKDRIIKLAIKHSHRTTLQVLQSFMDKDDIIVKDYNNY